MRSGFSFPDMPVYFKFLCLLKTKSAHCRVCSVNGKQSKSITGISTVVYSFKQILQMYI